MLESKIYILIIYRALPIYLVLSTKFVNDPKVKACFVCFTKKFLDAVLKGKQKKQAQERKVVVGLNVPHYLLIRLIDKLFM